MKNCNNCGITESQCPDHGRTMVKAPHSGDQDLCNECRDTIYGKQNPKVVIKPHAETVKPIRAMEAELVEVEAHTRHKPKGTKKAATKKTASKKSAPAKKAAKKKSPSKKA